MNDEINKGLICPYCGAESELIDSVEIYGTSYGMIRICRPCDAYVGCHANSKKHVAKGRLANKELRVLKIKAHKYFDPLWKRAIEKYGWGKKKARGKAYKWIAEELGIKIKDSHIGFFDIEQCKKVIELCQPYSK